MEFLESLEILEPLEILESLEILGPLGIPSFSPLMLGNDEDRIGGHLMLASVARAGLSTLSRTPVGTLARLVPGVETFYRDRVWSNPRLCNRFFGRFPTYEAALKAQPKVFLAGWNHLELAAADHFQPSLFASLFWLSQMLEPGHRVVDFGGSIGNVYYAFTSRAALPQGATWHVVEVPASVDRGRKIAEQRGAANLTFGTEVAEAGPCDILFSAGCLQYTEISIDQVLSASASLPRAVIINKIPLTTGDAFWTLQNLERCASPYRVFNEAEFLTSVAKHGYRLRDRWPVTELKLDIPFHPELYMPEMSGLVFERDGQPVAN